MEWGGRVFSLTLTCLNPILSRLPDSSGHRPGEVGEARSVIRLCQRHMSGCRQLVPARHTVRSRGLGAKQAW